MDNEKQFWKSIYYWIRYFDYHLINIEKNENEVWLANKNQRKIAIFRKDVTSTQEIRFDKSKIYDNSSSINEELSFEPKAFEFIYFTDKDLNMREFKETHPFKMDFHLINEMKDLERLMPNLMLSKLISRNNKTSAFQYKKRVLRQNPIDKYMMTFTPMTYLLIAINVLIWLIMILYLNHFSDVKLLDVGGLVHFNVVHGEWYRLITSMFLHFNFEHILMNMLSLFIFGKIVESIVGPLKMLGIYMISGLLGNFISLSFNVHTISVGASGAIFGLIGAIFAMMIISKTFDKKVIGQMLIALLIMVVLSLFMSNVNIMAHLGGFVGGILITLVGYYFTVNRNLFWIFLILLLVIFVALQIRIFAIKEQNIYDKLIQDAMLKYDYKEASHLVDHTINKGYDDAETYYLKGLITATTSSRAEGMADWERGLKKYPNSGLLNYELAIANRALNDNEKALSYAKKAVKNDSNDNKYKNLEKELKKTNETGNQ
ncbi:rhomboid family intramembrane serine protease [Staphylococcus croceilyticus]|uniref:Rhomboid family intramembrane serine protease n=2 Tax=Staphylococcus croceilyticus TaxID=319942 RepID=A0ABY2KBH3_9STAP|nr:rhomboid family intramembrane serine protease [Staphylococcus croceilyticus]TGA76937.1 rhomboid family intramembrane serine protease [Staphylococcus croceilyticus]